MNVKKNNIKYIVIIASVIAIISVIMLIALGGAKDDAPSADIELGITESEMSELEVIGSEVLSKEDKETEVEETESQMTNERETEMHQDAPSGDNTATTVPGNTGNSGSTNNGDASNNTGNSNAGNNGNNTESDKKPSNNQDVSTWVPTEDEHDISPYEQMVIDAGYGNVVDFGDGDYAVLTHADGYVNGKHGFEILADYLKNLGLKETSMNGGFIDSRYDWYMYIAKGTYEFDYDAGNEWTGDGEIEFID